MAETDPTALIDNLRRANGRWRTIAIGEALIFALLFVASASFLGIRAERARLNAAMQAAAAREHAERALREAAERLDAQFKRANH